MTTPLTPERLEEIRRWLASRTRQTIDIVNGRDLLREVDRQRDYIAGLKSALVKYEPWRKNEGTP